MYLVKLSFLLCLLLFNIYVTCIHETLQTVWIKRIDIIKQKINSEIEFSPSRVFSLLNFHSKLSLSSDDEYQTASLSNPKFNNDCDECVSV